MKISDCIDAGTEYCPCYLAETGDCIMCSQLQGKVFCDCTNWKGVCIYQEYVSNRLHMKGSRKIIPCKVLMREQVTSSVTLLTIQVSKTLARELNQPGAYVFLRTLNSPVYFDIPMSIMRVNERKNTVDIAVQERGIKTKSLVEIDNGNIVKTDELLLRGPYWNGIMGLKYIKGFQNGKALLIVRGIGQASALPVAKKLLQGGNEVEVLLDTGKIEANFTGDLFSGMGCHVIEKEVLALKSLTIPAETLEYIGNSLTQRGVGLIYCGGPDLLHQGVSRLLQQQAGNVYLASSNNAHLCCGEGVCGSCQTRLVDGTRVKVCKTQVEPLIIYGGR